MKLRAWISTDAARMVPDITCLWVELDAVRLLHVQGNGRHTVWEDLGGDIRSALERSDRVERMP